MPRVGLAGRSLRILVKRNECDDVRQMRIEIDGPYFNRAHEMTGLESNQTQTLYYDAVPEGYYTVIVLRRLADGTVTTWTDTFCRQGFETTCGNDLH